MSKPKFALLCLISTPALILLGAWLFVFTAATEHPTAYPEDYHCPFCDEKVLNAQTYYEGELVRVLLNYAPILPGQSMVIPKRHVARVEDLTAAEFAEMQQVINKVQRAFQRVYGTSDYLLCCQNGLNAGQTVYHVHFHMIPRQDSSITTKLELWWGMLSRPLSSISRLTPEETREQAATLSEAMKD